MAINHIQNATGGQFQPLLTLPVSQSLQAANGSKTTVSGDLPHASQTTPISERDIPIEKAAEKIRDSVNNLAQNLQFSIDEDTGKTVIKVMDAQTQEIIRQIPSKEAISIARTLDKVQGLLLNDEA